MYYTKEIHKTCLIIIMNDLSSEVLTCHLELFANNFKDIAPVRETINRQKVHLDLYAIEKWSQENYLP